MTRLRVAAINGENMADLVPRRGSDWGGVSDRAIWRGRLRGALGRRIKPDITALVEAPPDQARTEWFVEEHLAGDYDVYQGERRGLLGMALLVRSSLGIHGRTRTKAQSLADFKLDTYDSDRDGIKEVYSWANRAPLEVTLRGGRLTEPVTFIVLHPKSKGAFIPGDFHAYEQISRANRMKLRAQASAVRARVDALIAQGKRLIVLGDMNDGPEFDIYSALLGGGFLEPLMGSIWDPDRILHNPHVGVRTSDRWTIDFYDRVVNPLEASRYGAPTTMRSWIDHILLSPNLRDAVVEGSANIQHSQPRVSGLPSRLRIRRGTDHHPPYVDIDL